MESRLGGRRRRRGRPRRCPGGDRDGDGVDRISGLNDDLLIQILVRLRCVGAAVRTSVLSRRWRGLWRHIPELHFRGIAPDALESALAQIVVPKLSHLDIHNARYSHGFHAAGVASLLRTAARLELVELSMEAWVPRSDQWVPIEVPSFARATSIRLGVRNLHLTLPAHGGAGEFPVLETLAVTSCRLDTGAFVSRCPRLRVLELIYCWGVETITVHSETLEELIVISGEQLSAVDIVAPMLKKFTLHSDVSVDFTMSLLAPTVENLSWDCTTKFHDVLVGIDGIGTMWCLYRLKMRTEENGSVLGLTLKRPVLYSDAATHMRNLQEMFQLPNISVLELYVGTCGHVYGPMVLNLLTIYNAVQRLKLVTDPHVMWRDDPEECPMDCPCNQPQNWRSQNISLASLEEVEIENFKGSGHEVDFLKLLFRCAPLVNVTLKLASKVVATSRGCKETYNIFKANPATECHVYRNHGKEVIYA